MIWPRQDGDGRTVYAHVFASAVQKLGRVQLIVVREKRGDKLTEPRFWASSEVQADAQTLVGHLVARWDVEVLFADTKELLGLDHYQLIGAQALIHFWTVVLAAYAFLDEQRALLEQDWQRPVSIGQAQLEVQRVHWFHLITWMQQQFRAGQTSAMLLCQLAA